MFVNEFQGITDSMGKTEFAKQILRSKFQGSTKSYSEIRNVLRSLSEDTNKWNLAL